MLDKLLQEILDEFEKYDGNIDLGMKIIEANESRMDILKDLISQANVELNDDHRGKMELIIEKQKSLIKLLAAEKNDIFSKLNQINQKNKVVNSYLSNKKKSIFIDKDM